MSQTLMNVISSNPKIQSLLKEEMGEGFEEIRKEISNYKVLSKVVKSCEQEGTLAYLILEGMRLLYRLDSIDTSQLELHYSEEISLEFLEDSEIKKLLLQAVSNPAFGAKTVRKKKQQEAVQETESINPLE